MNCITPPDSHHLNFSANVNQEALKTTLDNQKWQANLRKLLEDSHSSTVDKRISLKPSNSVNNRLKMKPNPV